MPSDGREWSLSALAWQASRRSSRCAPRPETVFEIVLLAPEAKFVNRAMAIDRPATAVRVPGLRMASSSPAGEDEIVNLVAEAHTNDEIGALLHISTKTVERHRANVLEKLGMRDRVELTRYAIRRGLIEP